MQKRSEQAEPGEITYVNTANDPKNGLIVFFTNEISLTNDAGRSSNDCVFIEPGKAIPAEIRLELQPTIMVIRDGGLIQRIFVYCDRIEFETDNCNPAYIAGVHLVLASIIGLTLALELSRKVLVCYLPRDRRRWDSALKLLDMAAAAEQGSASMI